MQWPRWNPNQEYHIGDSVNYQGASNDVVIAGRVYHIIQPHISQADWTPPDCPALWGQGNPAGSELGKQHVPQNFPTAPPYHRGGEGNDRLPGMGFDHDRDGPWEGHRGMPDPESHHPFPEPEGHRGFPDPEHHHGPPHYMPGDRDHDRDWDRKDGEYEREHHRDRDFGSRDREQVYDAEDKAMREGRHGGGFVGEYRNPVKYNSSAEWIDDARRRAREFSQNGQREALEWLLAEPGNIPTHAIQAGEDREGNPVFVIRNFHEGGLHIGWAGLRRGAFISYGGQAIPLTTFEVLVGHSRYVRWVASKRRDGRPIEAGYEADGKPLWVCQTMIDGTILPGKTAAWDSARLNRHEKRAARTRAQRQIQQARDSARRQGDKMPLQLPSFVGAHRTSVYAACSTALVGMVILNAFRKHSNFYSIAVYLSKSNGSVMVLTNFGLLLTLLFGNVCRMLFFGPLRPAEVERLYDRMWFFVTESLLAFTIFRDDFDTPFVMSFGILLFVKSFHWIVADRIDWMDQVPYPGPPKLFHLRTIALLYILWAVDIALLVYALDIIATYGIIPGIGPTLLFASEYAILLASCMNAWLKYGVACWDLWRARSRGGENAPVWEDKSMFIFYAELLTDFMKLLTYLTFFGVVMGSYGLPLNVIRDVYVTARSFLSRVQDLVRYRKATKNMDQRYPNATQAELDATSDKTCIICREDMVLPGASSSGEAAAPQPQSEPKPADGPNETPKKLPCGHIFHFHCLRSWLERQQSCPTCRRSVLENPPAPTATTPAPPAPGARPNPPANDGQPQPQPGQQENGGAPPARPADAPDREPIVNAQRLLERLGIPLSEQVRNQRAQQQPRTFQGFNAGGQWQPWAYGQPQRQQQQQNQGEGLTPTPTRPAEPATSEQGPSGSGSNPSSGTAAAEPSTVELSARRDEETEKTEKDVSSGEQDEIRISARQAAAEAFLKRFGGSAPTNPSSTSPTPLSNSPPSTQSTSTGRARDLLANTLDVLSGKSDSETMLLTEPQTRSANKLSSTPQPSHVPPLIPLFDPSAISSSQANRTITPLNYSQPFLGFPFLATPPTISNFVSTSRGASLPASDSLPLDLSDDQLARIDQLTREAVQERLKVLEGVQRSLWKSVEDLTRLSSVLPPSGSPQEEADPKGKGKEPAF
ncbi:E3 ubiquitin-protein ligase hrd1 [Tulasnella sp. 427]|nr:E3 ubiquitin-protein ligase hrd1 [Tulasnella sp. 427]